MRVVNASRDLSGAICILLVTGDGDAVLSLHFTDEQAEHLEKAIGVALLEKKLDAGAAAAMLTHERGLEALGGQCSMEGCRQKVHKFGLCLEHYHAAELDDQTAEHDAAQGKHLDP